MQVFLPYKEILNTAKVVYQDKRRYNKKFFRR